MESLRQIMYGVADFALMRTGNAYFVDRRLDRVQESFAALSCRAKLNALYAELVVCEEV